MKKRKEVESMKKRLLAMVLSAVLALQPTVVTLAEDHSEHLHDSVETVTDVTDVELYETADILEPESQETDIL